MRTSSIWQQWFIAQPAAQRWKGSKPTSGLYPVLILPLPRSRKSAHMQPIPGMLLQDMIEKLANNRSSLSSLTLDWTDDNYDTTTLTIYSNPKKKKSKAPINVNNVGKKEDLVDNLESEATSTKTYSHHSTNLLFATGLVLPVQPLLCHWLWPYHTICTLFNYDLALWWP